MATTYIPIKSYMNIPIHYRPDIKFGHVVLREEFKGTGNYAFYSSSQLTNDPIVLQTLFNLIHAVLEEGGDIKNVQKII